MVVVEGQILVAAAKQLLAEVEIQGEAIMGVEEQAQESNALNAEARTTQINALVTNDDEKILSNAFHSTSSTKICFNIQ